MSAPVSEAWFEGLRTHARRNPDAVAISHSDSPARGGLPTYTDVTFAELDAWSDALAGHFTASGIGAGIRTVVLVNPGPELYAVLFGLFKAGAVPVVIDPGMGIRPMLRCLSAVEPQAFVGIPKAHAVRVLFRRSFRTVGPKVTVGRRWFWRGPTLAGIGRVPAGPVPPTPRVSDSAPTMIAFTTGSTGPAKAVELTHGNLAATLKLTQELTGVDDSESGLVTLPMFGILYLLIGSRIALPPLIPSRVGATDPAHVVDAVTRFEVRTLFASPAVLAPLLEHCRSHGVTLPSIRAVFSGGAPVPAAVVTGLRSLLPETAEVYAGYGATEAIPMAAVESREIDGELAELTRRGAGTLLGRPVPGVDVRIVGVTDEPIETWDRVTTPVDGVGEIVVSGPNVSTRYRWPEAANPAGKIAHGTRIWHRTGDIGRIDADGRIWFCGRKSQRVVTAAGTIYPVQAEQIANVVDGVARTALVGIGDRPTQRPALCVELVPGADAESTLAAVRARAADFPLTAGLDLFLVHPGFPVDIRHNAKIGREQLATWAGTQLQKGHES